LAGGKVMLNADWGCCRRKQSSSEGGDLAPDRKIENIIYQCDDTEHSTMGAGRTDARALTVQTIYCKQRRTRRLKFLPLWGIHSCSYSCEQYILNMKMVPHSPLFLLFFSRGRQRLVHANSRER
uniref:Uncharacterized protein n=1 Tax=Scophthalmus maximus TaxID=52904 RepID=A0A8D3DTC9_SCOMX